MKRLSVCMLFGCVFALGLGVLSCEAAEQKTRTLTDANGREVELNEDIQKAIVSNRYNLEVMPSGRWFPHPLGGRTADQRGLQGNRENQQGFKSTSDGGLREWKTRFVFWCRSRK